MATTTTILITIASILAVELTALLILTELHRRNQKRRDTEAAEKYRDDTTNN